MFYTTYEPSKSTDTSGRVLNPYSPGEYLIQEQERPGKTMEALAQDDDVVMVGRENDGYLV
jgi:hypothetical protein